MSFTVGMQSWNCWSFRYLEQYSRAFATLVMRTWVARLTCKVDQLLPWYNGKLSLCFRGGDLPSLVVYGALSEIAKRYIALNRLLGSSCEPTCFVLIWACGRHQNALYMFTNCHFIRHQATNDMFPFCFGSIYFSDKAKKVVWVKPGLPWKNTMTW